MVTLNTRSSCLHLPGGIVGGHLYVPHSLSLEATKINPSLNVRQGQLRDTPPGCIHSLPVSDAPVRTFDKLDWGGTISQNHSHNPSFPHLTAAQVRSALKSTYLFLPGLEKGRALLFSILFPIFTKTCYMPACPNLIVHVGIRRITKKHNRDRDCFHYCTFIQKYINIMLDSTQWHQHYRNWLE